jgi:DNA-directed RNA polymerase
MNPQVQVQLEDESLGLTAMRFRTRNQKLSNPKKDNYHLSDTGQALIRKWVTPVGELITQRIEEGSSNPARCAEAIPLLRDLDPYLLGYLAVRAVVSKLVSDRPTVTAVSDAIGALVNAEIQVSWMAESHKGLYATVKRNLDTAALHGHLHAGRIGQFRRAMKKKSIVYPDLDGRQRMLVGTFLLNAVYDAIRLFETDHMRVGRKTFLMVQPNPALREWIDKYEAHAEFLRPLRWPMVVKPDDWGPGQAGGYITDRQRLQLVNGRSTGFQQELKFADLPLVYDAMNYMQAVGWKVNQRVLDVVRQAWDAGLEWKGVPRKDPKQAPPRPDRKDKEAYKKWKKEWGAEYRKIGRSLGQRIGIGSTLMLAERFSKFDQFYFPYNLDFRGRMYCVVSGLSPQGSDLAKGLLLFSEGKPIGNGSFWLAVHVANTFGYDKVDYEQRVRWVADNQDAVLSVAADPLENKWWLDADKPIQFLAACLEYGRWHAEGDSYVCHLPVHVDGSCNGIQHYAAMSRDEVAGSQVNLVPDTKPSDIYAAVAERVVERLRGDGTDLGRRWIEWGIDRGLCKRPVMVLPYGGTRNSCRAYVIEHCLDQDVVKKKGPLPFSKDEFSAAITLLSKTVWAAMHDIVDRPLKIMDWLREAARLYHDSTGGKVPLVWKAPSGWIVRQAYFNYSKFRIQAKMGDKLIRLGLRQISKDGSMDRRRQTTALPPNFVHSLDAAALCFTLKRSRDVGINSFAAVHDSYGTLPSDMSTLYEVIREQFVEMYTKFDPLEEIDKRVRAVVGDALPPCPGKGKLDINLIRNSEFFFA